MIGSHRPRAKDFFDIYLKDSLPNANLLLSGKLVVDKWLKEHSDYTLTDFDWNMISSDSGNTFQLFLQGLRPVGYLVAAFYQTNDIRYFNLAFDFIKSWREYELSYEKTTDSEYVWDQHAAAMRCEYLLCFYLTGNEKDVLDNEKNIIVTALLEKHGAYLVNDDNYLMNENHGVFMDRSLIYLSVAFGIEKWFHYAKNRLQKQFEFLFSEEGVCVENSFAYQRININLFLQISVFLEEYDTDGCRFLNTLKKAQDYMGYALLPDGSNPPFGDSERSDYRNCECIDNKGILKYASTLGKEGSVPLEKSIAYSAGYFFGREFWGANPSGAMNYEDSVWTMFRSGYKTITHRQADDNHFILYGRGHNIFADSGVYNYDFRNPIRMYVRSANAHNTVTVDEQSTAFLRSDLTDFCGFIHSEINKEKDYSYIAAYNALYMGVLIIRHFIYTNSKIILVDEIKSGCGHKFSQIFHCGKNISVSASSAERTVLSIGDSGYFASVKQLASVRDLKLSVCYGEKGDIPYGTISEAFNSAINTNTLKYDICGKDIRLVTAIEVGTEKGIIPQSDISTNVSGNCIDIASGNESLQIQLINTDNIDNFPKFKYPMDLFLTEIRGSRLYIENQAEYKSTVRYAWYLIDVKTRRHLYLREPLYSDAHVLDIDLKTLDFPAEHQLSVRVFILDANNVKQSQNLCSITNTGEGYSLKRDYEIDAEWTGWERA